MNKAQTYIIRKTQIFINSNCSTTQRGSLASTKEGEFLANGVDYAVHDPDKNRNLTQNHAKMTHYQNWAVPAPPLNAETSPKNGNLP